MRLGHADGYLFGSGVAEVPQQPDQRVDSGGAGDHRNGIDQTAGQNVVASRPERPLARSASTRLQDKMLLRLEVSFWCCAAYGVEHWHYDADYSNATGYSR
jgi:hypothetical protein